LITIRQVVTSIKPLKKGGRPGEMSFTRVVKGGKVSRTSI
jgi:hypothetical protein